MLPTKLGIRFFNGSVSACLKIAVTLGNRRQCLLLGFQRLEGGLQNLYLGTVCARCELFPNHPAQFRS